ncbi:bifunctional GNAT family N-acetyltransferase/carbon-nitrogen hydrolase family protein [Aliiglaciecola sp. 3_MG-2023]|uniref:bifunctional GNAT family N-acetyltransferase/carbon-nitrogen hydrolase family protein n=1 Tax=Aliiglaciecola sp. 3_MG-2023 TaxID=3062644 RepID=UPI0026E29B40|nr:bifunctional GNAT family N-acetyltransferase/carbon-nitrogen hydrolase family protein [Aliiglaciecola sp. 3_MG-2023]MDO6693380.1 bifunctional GNAT family N-acetyltransferase/carbon-nitrogen hydrolase family protein [Aliiglaciecola sp. 3_MG-2023]
MSQENEVKLLARNLTESDFDVLKIIMNKVYPNLGGSITKKRYLAMLKIFRDGQICIEDDGKVVAAAFSVIVDYDKFGDEHTYDEITGNSYLTTHDPNGDVLYGIEVFVDPEYRNLRLGRRLYEARKELCQSLNLRAIILGGRIPNYKNHSHELSPQKYIEAVKRRDLYDPILTFQLSNDFEVKRVLRGYMPEDKESEGYATLLEWFNIYYEPKERKLFGHQKDSVRIGCVQWQMREMESVEELLQQFEYFVDALSDYRCDVALFPEFFNAPLMGLGDQSSSIEAIKHLSTYTEEILNAVSHMAVSYNINIIAGSMPLIEEDLLYNVAYICKRDGTIESQYKLHPTPSEKKDWAMEGGDRLTLFDTDFGRIGVLICYDVEFPELARLLSEEEMQILFVPFWTDTKNGYLRVKRCAQARAIENECYVAIAGSIGNLPKVDNVDIQYGQTAVFSPSDFAFPHDAVMAETTPNTEMTLIVDVDLNKLQILQNTGSVRNFLDKRRDLYRIEWLGEKSIVKQVK